MHANKIKPVCSWKVHGMCVSSSRHLLLIVFSFCCFPADFLLAGAATGTGAGTASVTRTSGHAAAAGAGTGAAGTGAGRTTASVHAYVG
jgi:hypothetical protein